MNAASRAGRLLGTVVLAAGASAALVGPAGSQGDSNPAELVGDPERGRALYVEYSCYACHGYTGETGSGTRLNPPRFNQVGFIAYVRNPATSYLRGNMVNVMPPYAGDDVSDQDLADVFAFIQSLESNSPPLEEIDLLTER